MVDWNSLARRKYDIMDKQAQAGMVGAQASATQAQTQATLAPSAIADTRAQTQQRMAETAGLPASQAAQQALQMSQVGVNQAGARQTNFGVDLLQDMPTDEARAAAASVFGGVPFPTGMFDPDGALSTAAPTPNAPGMMAPAVRPMQRPAGLMQPKPQPVRVSRGGVRDDVTQSRNGYAKGIAKVPGKGSPKKDTVKAKLAPGEAVLNADAAETMGRGLIAALNQVGAQRMGLV